MAAARTGAAPARPAAPSLLQGLQSLLQELPGLISDRVDLLALELQRFGRTLVRIVALGVGAMIAGGTAWLALWATIAAVLMHVGLPGPLVLLLVMLVNLAGVGLALYLLRRLLPLLGLPATRRHLMFDLAPDSQPAARAPAADAAAPARPAGPMSDGDLAQPLAP